MKSRLVRVSSEFDDYLRSISSQTGLTKTKISRMLVNDLNSSEINTLKNNGRKWGFKFDLKI